MKDRIVLRSPISQWLLFVNELLNPAMSSKQSGQAREYVGTRFPDLALPPPSPVHL